jgi:dienelactone hydrolase
MREARDRDGAAPVAALAPREWLQRKRPRFDAAVSCPPRYRANVPLVAASSQLEVHDVLDPDHRAFLDWVAKQPEFDAGHVRAAGYSMGAQMALLLAAMDSRASSVAAIVPPHVDAEVAAVSPHTVAAKLTDVEVWLPMADDDEHAGASDAAALFAALPGERKRHLRFAGGHVLPREYVERLQPWLESGRRRSAGQTAEVYSIAGAADCRGRLTCSCVNSIHGCRDCSHTERVGGGIPPSPKAPSATPTWSGRNSASQYTVLPQVGQNRVVSVRPSCPLRRYCVAGPLASTWERLKYAPTPNGAPVRRWHSRQ